MKGNNMQKIMIYTLFVLGILAVLVIIEMIREYYTFRVTDYQIESDKLSGLLKDKKVVFLSDLHNRVYGKDNSII